MTFTGWADKKICPFPLPKEDGPWVYRIRRGRVSRPPPPFSLFSSVISPTSYPICPLENPAKSA